MKLVEYTLELILVIIKGVLTIMLLLLLVKILVFAGVKVQ